MPADLVDILATARVVALPLSTPFRGISTREALLFEGPCGWSEFSPFLEYDDTEAAVWLGAAIGFAYEQTPPLVRPTIRVNATLPAVAPDEVAAVLDRFGPCRTVKVKVAEPGQSLADDAARVARTREYLGPAGRIRIDANGAWNVDEAEHAIHVLAEYDLEFVEQPCASTDELAQLRRRVKYMGVPIAADESVRKAPDPLEVALSGGADILVIKAQPLGGIRAALRIVEQAGLPAVVSSALDSAVGISMGLHLAAALPTLDFDCGLATGALLGGDVTESLSVIDGEISVERVTPATSLLERYRAEPERVEWWRTRLRRCYRLL